MRINHNALIITGPTASGKTQLSEMIAQNRSCEIINADVGQFYKPLSVGTAKPDLASAPYKYHLFDILDKPQDLSVVKYRSLVTDLVKDICSRGKIPVIVGGSLFYIKSLFFPPVCHPAVSAEALREGRELDSGSIQTIIPSNIDDLSENQKWELLQNIDPERAAMLHPNDSYRIGRALAIWANTGIKPSTYKPIFDPAFNALIVYAQPVFAKATTGRPDFVTLKDRIYLRTTLMISGWIEEAQGLIGTEWEEFLKTKNLIGYTEIFDWIKAGKNKSELPKLIEKIQVKTVQYAKRQRTFWKSFQNSILECKNLQAPKFLIQTMSVQNMSVGLPDDQILNQVLTAWDNFSNS